MHSVECYRLVECRSVWSVDMAGMQLGMAAELAVSVQAETAVLQCMVVDMADSQEVGMHQRHHQLGNLASAFENLHCTQTMASTRYIKQDKQAEKAYSTVYLTFTYNTTSPPIDSI